MQGDIASRLTAAWVRRPSPALVDAVARALVLLADHELATSTLAVRVACSVRVDAYSAIATGLQVATGPLHGAAAIAAADLLADAEANGAGEAVGRVLSGGRRLPGFGHAVYRNGDPRFEPLLTAVRRLPGGRRRLAVVDAVLAEAGGRVGKYPNIDFALAALAFAGGLPFDAPLLAVARIAGWGAHFDEECAERPVRFRGLGTTR
jgi:citrate synthase